MTAKALPGDKTRLLWLDLTRNCQLRCTHCYNGSGPKGDHGTMTRDNWLSVLDQAADYGVHNVQFIGGEPTMHPDFRTLVDHALNGGMDVEVYSNLVHVSEECWELFQRAGLRLATSYYSEKSEEHNAMTGRRTHSRTRTNIERAVGLGITVRVGIIAEDEKRVYAARNDLQGMGVTRIAVDHVRPFGRGGQDRAPNMANLCGQCGTGTAAVDPTGKVSPCVFSGWIDVGDVNAAPLADILGGDAMAKAAAAIRCAVSKRGCHPDQAPCSPDNSPPQICGPDDEAECSPGTPPSTCSPKR